ncbi:MAG: hypothetical protein ACI91G_000260 [Gammaproteobacteria bacterium]|jgi:uncharacterized protein (UPF0276 family)
MNDTREFPVSGAGLGLRRGALMREVVEQQPGDIPFFEVAPENWMTMGGSLGKQFRALTEKYNFTCHGLSLSIGSPAPLDIEFLKNVREFLDTHNILYYSEHLSYCSDDGHLYDLMPIPFTQDAINHVAERVQQAQDILGRRMAIENVSYYAAPGQEITELEFLNAVVEKADCDILLDVNNVYVNSINHQYDAKEFMAGLPWERIKYSHIAGHFDEAEDLRVDTHGADVIPSVWRLLELAYELFGPIPTLLERDFNIPPLVELKKELNIIRTHQNVAHQRWSKKSA